MKLEPIDTSTTAGKARVMQLAAEGRDTAERTTPVGLWSATSFPTWDWRNYEYAILVQPVAPDEVWGMVLKKDPNRVHCHTDKDLVESWAGDEGGTVVRYRRVEE